MDNIIKTIEANFLKDEYFFNGPCLKETVVNAEKTLEVYFPKTYRNQMTNKYFLFSFHLKNEIIYFN